WGRLVADDALHFPGDTRSILVRDVRNNTEDALATGDVYEFQVDVAGAAETFRATMAFTDSPAAAGAFNAVVNNVDLIAIAPSGTTYAGNIMAGGVSTPNAVTTDQINSVEQVIVNAPEVGVWTVRVQGASVNVG